ncbi:MAG TPA: putative Ig domain-containing protein [Luteitalea sp.]|nr:putative Ig domain-containing protein [Luteitalea sp.]
MTFSQHVFRAFVASTMVICASAAHAQTPAPKELVGTWKLTMTSPQGTYPSTLVLDDASGRLQGTVTIATAGVVPVTVETSDAGVKLSFSVDYQGQAVPVVMMGKLTEGTFKGTVDYMSGAAAGEFEGKKDGASSAVPAAGAVTAPAGVAGNWTIASSGGSGWAFELTQDATTVAGFLKNADQGMTLPVKGTLEGDALSLTITGDVSGTIKGTLDSSGVIKGTYVVDGNSGNFSATRKP